MSRELDALVAEKVFRWHIDTRGLSDLWLGDDGLVKAYGDVWSPTTFISDAWLVVEEMRKRGYETYVWVMPERFDPGKAHARFVGKEFDRGVESIADTAPEAICRAALEAVK